MCGICGAIEFSSREEGDVAVRRMLAAIVHRGPDEEGFLHGWDESTVATLLVERKSFAAMFTGIVVLIFVVLIRLSVRRYGEWKLGIQPVRFRQRVWGACSAFFQPMQSGPMTVPIEKPSDRTAR